MIKKRLVMKALVALLLFANVSGEIGFVNSAYAAEREVSFFDAEEAQIGGALKGAKAKTQKEKEEAVSKRLDELIKKYKGTTWNGYWFGEKCKGFANLIFYKLFDVKCIGIYDNSLARTVYLDGAKEVGYLDKEEMTKWAMKDLLKEGMPGDYIQVRVEKGKKRGPHTMILVKTKKNGVKVFDCNSDGKNSVKVRFITWNQFYKQFKAMSLCHAKKYK